jgi:hypothetical protein
VFVTAEVTRSLQRVDRQPRNEQRAADTAPPSAASKVEAAGPAARVVVQASRSAQAGDDQVAGRAPGSGDAGRRGRGTAPFDAQVLLVAGERLAVVLRQSRARRVGAFAADLCGDAGTEFRAERAFPARLATWIQGVLPAEGVRTPKSLLDAWEVTPIAPTPHDVELLAGLAGQAPVGPDSPAVAPAPAVVRKVVSAAPDWAVWAVLALVVLALCERWTGPRSFRLGGRRPAARDNICRIGDRLKARTTRAASSADRDVRSCFSARRARARSDIGLRGSAP